MNPTYSGHTNQTEVHVWCVRINGDNEVKSFVKVLSVEERERASRFFRTEDASRYIASHAALRHILSHYVDDTASELKFQTGANGKPYLAKFHGSRIPSFNLSHSGDFALIAVTARAAVGVDIELVKPDFAYKEISGQFFTPRENEWLYNQQERDSVTGFYRLWVAKEAVLKGVGTGLSTALNEIDVQFSGEESATIWNGSTEWTVKELAVVPGYCSAIALPQRDFHVRVFHFNSGKEAPQRESPIAPESGKEIYTMCGKSSNS